MGVLGIPAAEVRPFDGLTENTIVRDVEIRWVERHNPFTGHVTREQVVTITSSVARVRVVDEIDGQHIHDIEPGAADQQTFAPDEIVRVARPAVIAKCSCGFLPAEAAQ